MPAVSKQQFKLMKGICEGGIKSRKDLPSKAEACEFVEGQSPKGLPKKKKKEARSATGLNAKQLSDLLTRYQESGRDDLDMTEDELAVLEHDALSLAKDDQNTGAALAKADKRYMALKPGEREKYIVRRLFEIHQDDPSFLSYLDMDFIDNKAAQKNAAELIKLALSEQQAHAILRSAKPADKQPNDDIQEDSRTKDEGIQDFTKELDKIETIFFKQQEKDEDRLNPSESEKTASTLVEMALESETDYIRRKIRE